MAKPGAIDFEDYAKSDLRIGKVLSAKNVQDSDKLIELTIDLGTETRTIITGMREFYSAESFVGKELPFVANIKPQTLRGVTSHGMLIAIETHDGPVLLLPEKAVAPGSPLE